MDILRRDDDPNPKHKDAGQMLLDLLKNPFAGQVCHIIS